MGKFGAHLFICFWEIFKTNFLSCVSGVDFKDIEYEELAAAIREVCKEQNIVVIEGQVSFTAINQ